MQAELGIQAIFNAAAALSAGEDRERFLDAACAGDERLRERVAALLRAHSEAGDFFGGKSPAVTEAASFVEEKPGNRIGPYKLLQEIGQGGMGVVFMAEQIEPVRRKVALKIVKPGMDTRQVIARFEAERQALSLMDHPNIARVLDAGTTESGRPYFVMELVKGQPITEYCDEKQLTPRQRLELLLPVCLAIQHAHQKGIIHRDVKPSNILVAEYDQQPVPKVIDFGVAKATSQALTEKTMFTGFGQIVGTLEYMSPEQAKVNQLDIDTRSDVYSLGVLMYELLAGSTPFDRQRLRSAAWDELLRIIREEEPPKPSTRLSDSRDSLPSISAHRQTEPAKLTKLVRGELDWIVMKALEKDRARRYETAGGLARDIQRYLTDEIVEARPPSAVYRLKKFIRRHPLQLALAAAVALLVMGGVSTVLWQYKQAIARRETDLQRQLVDGQREAEEMARLARNADAVMALLGQCEQALQADDAAQAAVALFAARQRSAEGGAEKEATRLEWLAADLALLSDFDEIDKFAWTRMENYQFAAPAVVATQTREALARFGINPDAVSADEAAARVSVSIMRERIVMALDRLLLQQKTAEVRALLRRLDSSPYRDAVRDAVLANDRAKVVELAGQDDAFRQPPGFAAFLGGNGAIGVERRRKLLQAAVRNQPGHLGLLMMLGQTYPTEKKATAIEAVRWYQAAVVAAPTKSTAYDCLALALTTTGQEDEAEACYRRAIQVDPKYAPTHYNLGALLRRQSRLEEAIACFRQAMELDPASPWPHSGLGDVLRDQGKPIEAIEAYRKAIQLDSGFAQAHNNLGSVFDDQDKLEEALNSVQRAASLLPASAEVQNNLGAVLSKMGRLPEAEAAFRRAIAIDPTFVPGKTGLASVLFDQKKLDEAAACYRSAIEVAPENADAHYALARVLHDQKKLEQATESYREAIRLRPAFPKALTNLACILRDQGALDESINLFHQALSLDGDIPEAWIAHQNLGDALLKKGLLDDALPEYRAAIRLNPLKPSIHNSYGLALLNKGLVDEAITELQTAIRLDPHDALNHNSLGAAWKRQGKTQDAIAEFQEALRLEPDNALVHRNLAVTFYQLGDLESGTAHYQSLIRLRPGDAESQNRLAWILAAPAHPSEKAASLAVKLAQAAAERAPRVGGVWNTLGVARFRSGDWAGAIEALKRSEEISPGEFTAFNGYFLAMAHWQLDRRDEARQWFEKAVQWSEGKSKEDDELRRFHAEAATMLGIAGSADPDVKSPAP